jgi:hypothetical protein
MRKLVCILLIALLFSGCGVAQIDFDLREGRASMDIEFTPLLPKPKASNLLYRYNIPPELAFVPWDLSDAQDVSWIWNKTEIQHPSADARWVPPINDLGTRSAEYREFIPRFQALADHLSEVFNIEVHWAELAQGVEHLSIAYFQNDFWQPFLNMRLNLKEPDQFPMVRGFSAAVIDYTEDELIAEAYFWLQYWEQFNEIFCETSATRAYIFNNVDRILADVVAEHGLTYGYTRNPLSGGVRGRDGYSYDFSIVWDQINERTSIRIREDSVLVMLRTPDVHMQTWATLEPETLIPFIERSIKP